MLQQRNVVFVRARFVMPAAEAGREVRVALGVALDVFGHAAENAALGDAVRLEVLLQAVEVARLAIILAVAVQQVRVAQRVALQVVPRLGIRVATGGVDRARIRGHGGQQHEEPQRPRKRRRHVSPKARTRALAGLAGWRARGWRRYSFGTWRAARSGGFGKHEAPWLVVWANSVINIVVEDGRPFSTP
eukprot:4607093-Prymnesium_polylepis.1